jgi:hypothetical protein
MLPSKTMLVGILWTLAVIAAVSRVPQARTIVFGA